MPFFNLKRHQVAVKQFCVSKHRSAPYWNDRYGADWFALSVEVFRQVVVLFCPGGLGGIAETGVDAVDEGLDPVHLGGVVLDIPVSHLHDSDWRHRLVGPVELLTSGGDGGVGEARPGGVHLDGYVVQVAETLLGDEAPCDGLECAGLTGHGDVVLLTGRGVLEDDVPVSELLVVELVFLELDALERAGDGPVGCRFAVSLADDGAF